MIDWINDNTWVVWIAIATVLALAELASLELVLLMFAVAALVAAGASALGAPVWLSFIVFGGVSVLLLMFVRPRFTRRLHDGPTLTVGHHNLVGRTGVVDEPVTDRSGRVTIDGQLWTARRSVVSTPLDVGTEVTVVSIEGATAIVAGKDA
ncbi:nodulation efficiency protein D [Aeromicrobium marinum DSM 15272]|uniref:Nodulation efficiency protein D n=1 Tax=Aeromicrobium marinum DSM 15272 TaxID=585531 RepID=E2SA03_9ACTN|nr:NfeD family protein [Aeromicrobium marinum]EFQ84077.1 nodulation efficiency protein D [Aeromicrobium marinum DSM 15272]